MAEGKKGRTGSAGRFGARYGRVARKRVAEIESDMNDDHTCPECGGDVLEVGYMPSVTEFVTGQKCQDCNWAETDRE